MWWHRFKKTGIFCFIVVGLIVTDTALNFTLYNPQFITPLYAFVLRYHILPNEASGYPLTDIATLNSGFYSGPRAAVIGTVEEVLKSGDGDFHVNITNKHGTIVTEVIPEYPLPIPEVGDQIRIWGITRYDIAHRWWEIHPVMGWQKIKFNTRQ